MYPVLLNLRRKRLIINDYLITQAAPLVQIFFSRAGGSGWASISDGQGPERIYNSHYNNGVLALSVVQLKGKHCRKPHCPNGVVDMLGRAPIRAL